MRICAKPLKDRDEWLTSLLTQHPKKREKMCNQQQYTQKLNREENITGCYGNPDVLCGRANTQQWDSRQQRNKKNKQTKGLYAMS